MNWPVTLAVVNGGAGAVMRTGIVLPAAVGYGVGLGIERRSWLIALGSLAAGIAAAYVQQTRR